jgi:hypothetical protein
VAVPAVRPVTSPVLLTVATAGLLESQVPLVEVGMNVVVLPIQISCVPLIVPGLIGWVTNTVLVAVAMPQPGTMMVYRMDALPTVNPVTTPVVGLTVATAVFVDDQVPPTSVEARVVVPPRQIACWPLMIPAVMVEVILI